MPSMRSLLRKVVNSNIILQSINTQRLKIQSKAMQKAVANVESAPEKKASFIKKNRRKYNDIIEQSNREIQMMNNVSIDSETRNDIIFCAIAYGFLPIEYISYNLKGKNYVERRSFLSDRDSMDIVHLCNDPIDIQIYNDKARTYEMFSLYYGREAVCIQNENDKDKFLSFILGKKEFVKKNVGEAMGRSIQRIDVPQNAEEMDGLFHKLIQGKEKLLLEERITQNEIMEKLNPSSVNTIRIITFNIRNGIIVPYCFLKIGRKDSFVDNGGAGGILIGVDVQTGMTNTYGRDEYGKVYEHHPDTGLPLNGIQLPEFQQAIELAKHISALTPKVKYIGWDFAYTSKGWIVVEGNGKSQLIGPQLTMQCGLRSEIETIITNLI